MDPDIIITQASDGISEKLNEVSGSQSECTIYRVHRHLRNVNPRAYEPEVIAIGPYHRHNNNSNNNNNNNNNNSEHLKMMEGHKLSYLKQLLGPNDPLNGVKRYVAAVSRVEAEARRCYADLPETLTPAEFIQMLVLDGCFIVQLVRKFKSVMLRERNDPIFQMNWMINSLQRDLMLFENQLPFFVLCELYDLIEVPGQHSRFWYLLFNFFISLYPGQGSKQMPIVHPRQVKHLLDFLHQSWLPPPRCSGGGSSHEVITLGARLRFISSATRLKEANVKFDNRSNGNTLFDVRFEKGSMIIAPLTIEDRTESFLRNLIAYEQYFEHNQNNFVTDYVKFLDCIVDSSADVEILSRRGIIDNWLGDEGKVAEMVNKLGDSVAGPGNGFVYAKMFEDVHNHCRKRKNNWMAKLRRCLKDVGSRFSLVHKWRCSRIKARVGMVKSFLN
ncbi:hypothetical protein SASPL_100285 [Salvia splendens]|uniref:Uncharacterized protein n=1 Tax=Salvia splendens TaxID=180675 RepID=A0A8X8YRT2_SALSN|nr:UPF0481 protein At3g47200-like isoform X2 [Salvia splendens]KAG6435412.1 hypothetical protein SASPL_100285 [Salvia splendens]